MNYEREFELYRVAIDIGNLFSELETLRAIDTTCTVSTDINAIKKLADMATQSRNVELQESLLVLRAQIITFKESLLEVREENLSLKEENVLLKRKLVVSLHWTFFVALWREIF